LHRDPAEESPSKRRRPALSEEVRDCLSAFVETTGWAIRADDDSRLAYPRSTESELADPRTRTNLGWKLIEDQPIDTILSADDLMSTPWVGRDEATRLLTSIEQLVERLEVAESTVRHQEAELAAGVGLSVCESQSGIADRLEEILTSTATTLRCHAAALYLLDDSTSELKMRSCFGLPESRLTQPPRPLRGALGDLEALMGNAVLLDDLASIPEWQSPEAFGSAICVPIGTVSMPLGTIWFWCEEPKRYTPRDAEIANMAANRTMLELERKVMGSEVAHGRRVHKQLDAAGLTQASRLPDSQPLHRQVEIDGWSFQDDCLGGAFHDWDMTPKGNIVAAVGRSQVSGAEGAIVASWLQGAMRSNWLSLKSPKTAVHQLNDQLWGSGDADWTSSLGLFQLNPDTGYGSMCSAGDIQSFIVSNRGYRPLGNRGPNLAEQPDPTFQLQRFILQPGEVLVAFTSTVAAELLYAQLDYNQSQNSMMGASNSRKRRTPPPQDVSQTIISQQQWRRSSQEDSDSRCPVSSVSQQTILDLVRENMGQTASNIASNLARSLPAWSTRQPGGADRSLIVLRNNRKK
jgi:hypothetical protein